MLCQVFMKKSMDCKGNKVIFVSSNKQIGFVLERHFTYTESSTYEATTASVLQVTMRQTQLMAQLVSRQLSHLGFSPPLGI